MKGTVMEDLQTNDITYQLDESLYMFLSNIYNDNTIRWVNIFQHLSNLNSIRHNKNVIFLEKLEERMLDIIRSSTDTESIPMELEIYMKRSIEHYLNFYGISINLDVSTIYTLEELLSAYVSLFNLDLPSTEQVLEDLGDDTIDPIERFVNIVKNYFTYSEAELFDMLSSVDEEWFEHMRIYFTAKIRRGMENINQNDIEKVLPLLKVDKRFSITHIVQDTLYYGYASFNFDTALDALYTSIDAYEKDVDMIALEIVATNYLSYDKPIRDLETLEKNINLVGLAHFTYIEALDNITNKVLDLLDKIKG